MNQPQSTELISIRVIGRNLAVFAIYFITARLGLKLGAVSGFATLVWPPTGIALAALLLLGRNLWPGIALGAFFVNLSIGASFPVALAMSIGNALEAVVGAALLRKAGFQPSLERLKSVASLVLFSAFFSTLISATLGTTALFLDGKLTASFGSTWLAWWFGDMMGDLIVAPFLLVWGSGARIPREPRQLVEAIGLLAIVILTSIVFFTDLTNIDALTFPRPYLAFPALIFIAVRLGQIGSVTAVLITSIIVIGATSTGHGHFWMGSISASLLEAQVFLGILSVSKMVLAAANTGRIKSEAQLLLISNTLPAFVTYIDQEERYRFVNDAYLRWIGKTREQVMGRAASEILGEDIYQRARPNILQALRGEPVRYDLEWKSAADGKVRVFQIEYTPDVTPEMGVKGYVMHGLDVTDLRKAISSRDEFMSIASHELKTPLTTLKLKAYIRRRNLEKGVLSDFSHERLPKMVADDERQIGRLTRLVDDMLDVSRITSGKLQLLPEEVDLGDLVREVADRFEPQLLHTGIQFTIDAPSGVTGLWDRNRIEQVFTNLLTNALKYGEGNPVSVRVGSQNGVAHLSVQDHGIGISNEDRARIFELFERAVSPAAVSGLGLGLYIVRQIVVSHGGTIRVESKMGQGSTFHVDLPMEDLASDFPSTHPTDHLILRTISMLHRS